MTSLLHDRLLCKQYLLHSQPSAVRPSTGWASWDRGISQHPFRITDSGSQHCVTATIQTGPVPAGVPGSSWGHHPGAGQLVTCIKTMWIDRWLFFFSLKVNQLSLTNYSILQRIPDDQPLACQCFKTTDLNFGPNLDFYPAECIDGYTVELSGILWAGLIPNDSNPITELPTVPCLNVSNTTDPLSLDTFSAWVESVIMEDGSNPAASPVDVVPYQGVIIPGGGAPVTCYENYTVDELVSFKPSGVEFTVDSCFRGFCNGTIETNWFLSDVNQPCVSDREGVLCGQCKKGLSITLTTTVSPP